MIWKKMNYKRESIHGYYLTLMQNIVKSMLSEARLRRSIISKEKSDSLIKVSQECYDSISAVVCQKLKYNIFITLKYKAHRDVASF